MVVNYFIYCLQAYYKKVDLGEELRQFQAISSIEKKGISKTVNIDCPKKIAMLNLIIILNSKAEQ